MKYIYVKNTSTFGCSQTFLAIGILQYLSKAINERLAEKCLKLHYMSWNKNQMSQEPQIFYSGLKCKT